LNGKITMYQYNPIDQSIVDDRVKQFRGQVERRLQGTLPEEEFRPLRLQNGLYLQRHAYMLRIAIPYGLFNSQQMRMFAKIADKYDRGYGHFTTRQNIQFNWLKLEETPEILADLASVQMHAIQTSGNCVRNITSDPFAGVAADEIVDPRPICELLRQWSTLHPEFAFLPRKFKIAVSSSKEDRAIVAAHDLGLFLRNNEQGELVADVLVGGGMGRTPIIGTIIQYGLPWQELPNYISAVLRVYNLHGRRDNLYKARIKILLKALGVEEFTRQVNEEYQYWRGGHQAFTQEEWNQVAQYFVKPAYKTLPSLNEEPIVLQAPESERTSFSRWLERNVKKHQIPGYASVLLSLKPHGTVAPGDIDSSQMIKISNLADQYSFGLIRSTHEQNLVLADVEQTRLYELWKEAKSLGLALPNIGLLTDIIACPGGDFCSLANAKSIPIANDIQKRFDDLDYLFDIGDITLNISGCINSCGHHHVGNIGILGVDKDGQEWYQVTLGGEQGLQAAIGKVIGPSFFASDMPDVISDLIQIYIELREPEESFIQTYRRVGVEPFKTRVYANKEKKDKKNTVGEDAHG
jgi:sulfite reductase (NADPH) hemoprotein beta-component